MRQQDIDLAAAEDHMVSRKMAFIKFGNGHVGQTIDRDDDRASTGRNDDRAEDSIASRVGWHHAIGAQS